MHRDRGAGPGFTSLAITLEEVGLGANPIYRFGTEAQRQQWLPDLCAGRALGGFGLTEPDAGSDAGGTRTTARLEGADAAAGGEWVIDGEKAFITNSGTDITSLVTVTARTGGSGVARPRSSTITVPAGTPGLTVQPPYRKMGWHRRPDTHGLGLTGCRVPAVTRWASGAAVRPAPAHSRRGPHRIAALAGSSAAAWNSRWPTPRAAFGRAIGANQAVAFACSDLAVMAETASLFAVPGRLAARDTVGTTSARPPWPSCTPPSRPSPPPAWPPRCSAATGSSTRRWWPASTATPRSWRSARAPARSSAWSSPVTWACRWG